MLHLALFALTLNPAAEASTNAPADPAQMRQVVDRGLKFLERDGLDWVSKKCVSCHHGPLMLLSHHEAQKRGFSINQKALDQVRTRAVKDYSGHAKLKPTGQDELNDLSMNAIYLSVGLGAAEAIDAETATALDKFAAHLIEKQKADGSWHVFIKNKKEGLMQPIFDRDDVTTMWALLVLSSREPAGITREALTTSKEKALKWLKENPASDTNQSLVLRILLKQRLGTSQEVQDLVRQLRDKQALDGGWSQEAGKPSDALATGQSLHALTRAGVTAQDPAVQRAWGFLLKTQKPDGSWLVPSRAGGSPKFSSYIGSGWATVGLVQSLEPQSKVSSR